MGDMILYRSGGGGGSLSGYPVGNVTNFKVVPADTTAAITWTDPDDINTSGGAVIKWNSTRIVRKLGSFPTSEIDGTIVVESTVKNQYKTNEFIDTGLTEGTTYYYAAFSCSDYGIYSRVPETMSVTTVRYRVMTVVIDESNRNPDTCCTYADDAVELVNGCDEKAIHDWQEFFKYKPCLVCGDEILGYLNPNDWTKMEDGAASGYHDTPNIPTDDNYTSNPLYHAGKQKMMHVFIEIPIMGIRITKSGSKVTVSMTDNPNKDGFIYYPFYRNGVRLNRLYINTAMIGEASYVGSSIDGEYLGFDNPSKPYGFNNFDRCVEFTQKPKSSLVLPMIRNSLVGSERYELLSFYQFLLLQCMVILQFKRINNFDDVLPDKEHTATSGMFYVSEDRSTASFDSQYYLYFYEYTFFGIRSLSFTYRGGSGNFYRHIAVILDGIKRKVVNRKIDTENIYLCSNGSYETEWDSVDGYSSFSHTALETKASSYISKVVGNNSLGFLATERAGSSTTYYNGVYGDVLSFSITPKFYVYCTGYGHNPSGMHSIQKCHDGGIFSTFGIVVQRHSANPELNEIYGDISTVIRTTFLK